MWDSQKQHPGEAFSLTPVGGVRLQVHTKGSQRKPEGPLDPFGGIYVTLRLGLRKEKWRDFL